MQHQLGTLGSVLAQAAKDSDSSLADIINTKKQSIEKEQQARLQKVAGKPASQKRPARKRPRQQQHKEGPSQKATASKSSESPK